MTNAICESYNLSWVTIDTCRLRAVQRNKTVFNVDLTLLQPVKSLTIRLQVLKKANGYKPWIIDTTFDACQFLRAKKKKNLIAKLILDLFQDFSTFNHSCPYMVSFYQEFFCNFLTNLFTVGATDIKRFLSDGRKTTCPIAFWGLSAPCHMELSP